MRRIAFFIAAAALAPLIALNGAAPSYAGSHARGPHATAQPQVAQFASLCEKDSPGLCWRDPSDGGPGTAVVNSGSGTDNARLWEGIIDFNRCKNSADPGGGFVTNTPPCPFTGGSGLNATYQGDAIFFVENAGSGYCAGSSFSDLNKVGTPIVKMHTCDGVGSELSSVFVEQDFATHFRLISVKWSNSCSCAEFVNGDVTNDDPLTIGPPGTWARWTGAGI